MQIKARDLIWPLLTWAALTVCFFWTIFANAGRLVVGSKGDPKFIISIFEHWYAVVQGHAGLFEPFFFVPVAENVYSFSDTFLLNAPFYIIPRFFGADEFLSFQLTFFGHIAFGFFTLYFYLKSRLKFSIFPSLVGSSLFAFSGPILIFLAAFQNASWYFTPALVLLGDLALRRLWCGDKAWLRPAVAGVALLGLISVSTFYVAWYVTLLMLPIGALLLIFNWRQCKVGLKTINLKAALVLGASTLLSVLPTILLYGPLLLRGVSRDYSEILPHLLFPSEYIHSTGLISNLIIGPQQIRYGLDRYVPSPVTFGLALSLVIATGVFFRRALSPASWKLIFSLLALISFITFSQMRFGEFCIWRWIFDYFPGANAIRVVCRFHFGSALLLALVTAICLNALVAHCRHWIGKTVFIVIGMLMVVDQWGYSVDYLDRDWENSYLNSIPPPPCEISAFMFADVLVPERNFDTTNVDAMLFAHRFRTPTLHGYSGWIPQGFDLFSFIPTPEALLVYLDNSKRKGRLHGYIGLYQPKTRQWFRVQTPGETRDVSKPLIENCF